MTIADKDDVAAMVADIAGARAMADVVIVSMHWGVHLVPAMLAMYQQEVGHIAIDAGADLIIGHHPHILKAVEVYKGKVIFYSVGNFIVPSRPDRGQRSRLDVRPVRAIPDRSRVPALPAIAGPGLPGLRAAAVTTGRPAGSSGPPALTLRAGRAYSPGHITKSGL